MRFYCEKCGKLYDVAGHDYMCECGGMFRLKTDEADEFKKSVSIGEGVTPLLDFRTNNQDYLLKMESLQPTGSFKDRGAFYMINELYPEIYTTSDFNELLSNPEIKAMCIVTPSHTHFKLVKQALLAGKHVYVEKPISTSSLKQKN